MNTSASRDRQFVAVDLVAQVDAQVADGDVLLLPVWWIARRNVMRCGSRGTSSPG